MAQMTGTQIVALARIYALDNDASNLSLIDADALLLLNHILNCWAVNVRGKPSQLAATTTSLTFGAGVVERDSAALELDGIMAAYQAGSSSDTTGPFPPELRRRSVEEIRMLINDTTNKGTTQGGGGTLWQMFAAEQLKDSGLLLRVYVWPPLSAAASMTLKVTVPYTISALSSTPDVSQVDAGYIARYLAWDMVALQRVDDAVLNRILYMVPGWIKTAMNEGTQKEAGRSAGQARAQIISEEA